MTVDAPASPNAAEMTRADEFAQAIGRQRAELEAFLGAQRERLAGAEARLSDRLQNIARELAQTQAAIRQTQEEQATRAEQLATEAEDVARLKRSLEASQTQWHAAQEQATEQQRQLAQQIQVSQEALAKRFDELTAREARIAEAEARLRRDEETLALAEAKSRQREQDLAQSCEALDTRARNFESQLSEAARHECALENELAAARQTCVELKGQLADQTAGPRGDDESREELQSERDALAQRLDEAQERLAELQRQLDDVQTGASSRDDAEQDESRYETAMEDLRRLKTQNERLEKQLAEARAGGLAGGSHFPGAADWESQKRRLMAALEDIDEDDEQDIAERIRIETVIKSTDAAVAAKDEEIRELKRLVEQQRGQAGSATAILPGADQRLDQDAVIQQEREKLRCLQDELQAKLRQAEIEISIERADMARQRMEIEEIMRQFAEDSAAAASLRSGGQTPDKLPGRRWLVRLGLKKQDDEE